MRYLTCLASLAIFHAVPGLVTLACLVATGFFAVAGTIHDDIEADAK